MRFKITEVQEEFMRTEGKAWSGKQLADKFGYSNSMIHRWRRENGLSLSHAEVVQHRAKSMTGKTTFPPELDVIIKENYLTIPIKALAAKIGRSYTGVMFALKRMGLTIPSEIVEERKQLGRIKNGSVPSNKGKKQVDYMSPEAIERCAKTRFLKGNIPHNTYEKDGIITTRIDKNGIPYLYIRVSVGNWKPYHRYIWEQVNGKIPSGHCLCFKDGNTYNTNLENLELVTLKENLLRNSEVRFYEPELKELINTHKQFSKQLNKVKYESTDTN